MFEIKKQWKKLVPFIHAFSWFKHWFINNIVVLDQQQFSDRVLVQIQKVLHDDSNAETIDMSMIGQNKNNVAEQGNMDIDIQQNESNENNNRNNQNNANNRNFQFCENDIMVHLKYNRQNLYKKRKSLTLKRAYYKMNLLHVTRVPMNAEGNCMVHSFSYHRVKIGEIKSDDFNQQQTIPMPQMP
eukprot:339072_1